MRFYTNFKRVNLPVCRLEICNRLSNMDAHWSWLAEKLNLSYLHFYLNNVNGYFAYHTGMCFRMISSGAPMYYITTSFLCFSMSVCSDNSALFEKAFEIKRFMKRMLKLIVRHALL